MSKLLASFVAALGLFTLSSCGDASSASPVGTYTLDKAAFKAQVMTMMPDMPKEMPEEMRKEALKGLDDMVAKMEAKVELKEDKTAVFTHPGDDDKTETETGTWKMEGNKITVTSKDKAGKEESHTGTYAGGVITMDVEREGKKFQMVFKK